MGFSSGFSSGFSAVTNAANINARRQEVRNQTAQVKAQLAQNGYDYNPTTGNVEANEVGKLNHQVLVQKLQQQQQMLEQQQKWIQTKTTHDVVKKAVGTGDWNSVNGLFKTFPNLAKTWGVVTDGVNPPVRNINLDDAKDVNLLVKQFSNNGMSPEQVKDEVQKLQTNKEERAKFLQTHFVANVYDKDGNPTTAIKDAEKVAAISGVDEPTYNVYKDYYQNRLNATSNAANAANGTYNLMNQKVENAKLTGAKMTREIGNLILDAENKKLNANLTQQKTNYYGVKALAAKVDISNKELDNQIKQAQVIINRNKASDSADLQRVQQRLPDLISTISNYEPGNVENENELWKDAKLLQNNNKLDATTANNIQGGIVAIKTGKKLLNEIDKIPFDPNAINSAVTAITKALPANWSKLSETQRKEALDRIKLSSVQGEWIAKYVQSISGAAVTDEEFARHFKNAFGNTSFTNKDAMKSAFSSFLGAIEDDTKARVNTIVGKAPYDALVYKKELYGDEKPKAEHKTETKAAEPKVKPKLDEIFGGNQ
jgi:hypothetical protein